MRVLVDGVPAGEWTVPSGSPDRYGEAIFPMRAAIVGQRSHVQVQLVPVSDQSTPNSFVYWVFAKQARKLETPIKTDVAGLWLTDHLDVGSLSHERDHGYSIEAPTFGGDQQFLWPDSAEPFLEDGRATAHHESFALTVIPGRDHLLVKAFDTYSKSQVVRVFIENRLVGDWALPDGPDRYGEGAVRIPARVIGNRRRVTVRVEFVSASIESNSFYYWMFAEPTMHDG